jgi:hypothetical protein
LAKDIDRTFQVFDGLRRRRTPCEGERKKEEKEKGPADKHQLPTLLRVKGIKEIAYASSPSNSLLAGSRRGDVLVDIFLDALLEDTVRLKDEIDGVPPCSLSAGIGSDVVGGGLHLAAGVGGGDGQAAYPHDRQIDHVITHIGYLVESERSTLHDFAQGTNFVVLPHVDVFHAQGTGTLGHRFGSAFGDYTGVDASDPRKGNADAVVGMEAFGFEGIFSLVAESWGEGPYLAVGEDSIYIEEYEAYAAGALWGGKVHSFYSMDPNGATVCVDTTLVF